MNTDREVLIKYRTNTKMPWQHTFSPGEVQAIATAISASDKVWLCLVCGDQSICALDKAEIQVVLDMVGTGQQWIKVEVPKGGSCHVSGSNGRLKKTVPHNSFPNKVFV